MNIAIISFWHVHGKSYADEAMKAGLNITAVWDENTTRGREWAKKLGCAFYDDYDRLLGDSSIVGVVITAATAAHTELIIKAARAGKHIFTEKVLALTLAECLEIKAAIERYDVHFTISFPHMCNPSLRFAKQLSDSGELGRIHYGRVRNVHNGASAGRLPAHFYNAAECGGGAMIDLGAHGMYLLRWLLGKPINCRSLFTKVTGKPVEDNAVCIMEFADGAIGVNETGFVSSNCPLTLEIGGDEGALVYRKDLGVSYASKNTNGKWINVTDLPAGLPTPLSLWIKSLKEGVDSPFGIDDAIALTEMMEGAYQAAKTPGFVWEN